MQGIEISEISIDYTIIESILSFKATILNHYTI